MTGRGLRARFRAEAGRLRAATAGHAEAQPAYARSATASSRRSPEEGRRAEAGQALIETVMATGFLVAIAIALNKMIAPVVLDAFEKISKALSAVGP